MTTTLREQLASLRERSFDSGRVWILTCSNAAAAEVRWHVDFPTADGILPLGELLRRRLQTAIPNRLIAAVPHQRDLVISFQLDTDQVHMIPDLLTSAAEKSLTKEEVADVASATLARRAEERRSLRFRALTAMMRHRFAAQPPDDDVARLGSLLETTRASVNWSVVIVAPVDAKPPGRKVTHLDRTVATLRPSTSSRTTPALVHHVPTPGREWASIRLAALAPVWDSAFTVANTLFGCPYWSRLSSLRQFSYILDSVYMPSDGYAMVVAEPELQQAGEFLRRLTTQLGGLASVPPESAEIDAARRRAVITWRLRLASPAALADQLGELLRCARRPGDLAAFLQGLYAVSDCEVLAACRRLRTDSFGGVVLADGTPTGPPHSLNVYVNR